MLEQLINLKLSMRHKESKEIVKQKFEDYSNAYDNYDKEISDKIRHREIFLTYSRYMAGSGKE